jgi:hypothetical protein
MLYIVSLTSHSPFLHFQSPEPQEQYPIRPQFMTPLKGTCFIALSLPTDDPDDLTGDERRDNCEITEFVLFYLDCGPCS